MNRSSLMVMVCIVMMFLFAATTIHASDFFPPASFNVRQSTFNTTAFFDFIDDGHVGIKGIEISVAKEYVTIGGGVFTLHELDSVNTVPTDINPNLVSQTTMVPATDNQVVFQFQTQQFHKAPARFALEYSLDVKSVTASSNVIQITYTFTVVNSAGVDNTVSYDRTYPAVYNTNTANPVPTATAYTTYNYASQAVDEAAITTSFVVSDFVVPTGFDYVDVKEITIVSNNLWVPDLVSKQDLAGHDSCTINGFESYRFDVSPYNNWFNTFTFTVDSKNAHKIFTHGNSLVFECNQLKFKNIGNFAQKDDFYTFMRTQQLTFEVQLRLKDDSLYDTYQFKTRIGEFPYFPAMSTSAVAQYGTHKIPAVTSFNLTEPFASKFDFAAENMKLNYTMSGCTTSTFSHLDNDHEMSFFRDRSMLNKPNVMDRTVLLSEYHGRTARENVESVAVALNSLVKKDGLYSGYPTKFQTQAKIWCENSDSKAARSLVATFSMETEPIDPNDTKPLLVSRFQTVNLPYIPRAFTDIDSTVVSSKSRDYLRFDFDTLEWPDSKDKDLDEIHIKFSTLYDSMDFTGKLNLCHLEDRLHETVLMPSIPTYEVFGDDTYTFDGSGSELITSSNLKKTYKKFKVVLSRANNTDVFANNPFVSLYCGNSTVTSNWGRDLRATIFTDKEVVQINTLHRNSTNPSGGLRRGWTEVRPTDQGDKFARWLIIVIVLIFVIPFAIILAVVLCCCCGIACCAAAASGSGHAAPMVGGQRQVVVTTYATGPNGYTNNGYQQQVNYPPQPQQNGYGNYPQPQQNGVYQGGYQAPRI